MSRKTEFEIRVTTGAMYRFLMHHVYHGFRGIFSMTAGAGLFVLFFLGMEAGRFRAALPLAAAVLLYEPWVQYVRAVKQTAQNPVFRKPLFYSVTERGITVSQDHVVNEAAWEQITRVYETRRSIYVYTGTRNAFIWEKAQIGGSLAEIKRFLEDNVNPEKRKRVKLGDYR